MSHIRRVLPTAVLVSLLIGKAGAEQPPQLLPTHDVDIIYDVTLPSQPRVRERVRFLAAELLERQFLTVARTRSSSSRRQTALWSS